MLNCKKLRQVLIRLQDAGIQVSWFIEADANQIAEVGANYIEIHTGASTNKDVRTIEGLDYHNVTPVAALAQIQELHIGHAVIAGLAAHAIHQMKNLMYEARR